VPDTETLRTGDRIGDTLRLVAARSGGSAEPYALGRDLGLDGKTAGAHLRALERLFAIRLLPAWSTNLGARITKAPRAYLADAGFHAHLLGATKEVFLNDLAGDLAGRLVETLVVNEVLRQAAWADTPIHASFYRDDRQQEVDLVLEAGTRVVGIEIKAAATVGESDARHLRFLRDKLGERFIRGVVIYTGDASVGLGDRLQAMPVGSLWS
jgi:uncharacterized protein